MIKIKTILGYGGSCPFQIERFDGSMTLEEFKENTKEALDFSEATDNS